MRRILSLFLVALLLASHGGIGDAASHTDGSSHTHGFATMAIDDHHDNAEPGAESEQPATSSQSDEPLGHSAGHVHVSGDIAPHSGLTLASVVKQSELRFSGGDDPLRGRAVDPLLEPPSA